MASNVNQWPPSLEIVVTFPCGSTLISPRLKSEKNKFPCESTTIPELGWPEAVKGATLNETRIANGLLDGEWGQKSVS